LKAASCRRRELTMAASDPSTGVQEGRILDGHRVIGVDIVELEVLFKGRFSDFGSPASPPV
jgi:hypothetical protein